MRAQTKPPYYYQSMDWNNLVQEYEPPYEFMNGTRLWERDRIVEAQTRRLKEALQRAAQVPFYQKLWKEQNFDPSAVRSIEDLSKVPQYTIDDIRESIERKPPFGDYQSHTFDDGAATPLRFYTSGGTTGMPRPTIYTQWDREVGAILSARTFYMQGVRPGDAVMNAWAYSTHNAAWIMDHGLWHWLGATPITTGTGNVTPTEKQVELAHLYGVAAITATSDYLLHIADTATRMGLDPKTDLQLKTLLSFGDTQAVEEAFGVPAYDSYAFHEVQYVAAECHAKQGLHIFEDAFIVEVVDFETGEVLPPGHTGNIVVTCLYKTGTHQIRYNIQDISAAYEIEQCECGSWHKKLAYFQGRSDTMVKLRGVNVWPEACGKIIAGHPGINGEYFCYVENVPTGERRKREEMTVLVERADGGADTPVLKASLEKLLKQKIGVHINIQIQDRDSLRPLTGHGQRAKLKRFEDRRGGPLVHTVVQAAHGELQLRPEDRPSPQAEPNEVLIDIEYCGLNHLDLWLKRGSTGDSVTLPRIPGSDIVGRVAGFGADVTKFRVGARVVLYPGNSCGSCTECLIGRESACRYFGVLGYASDGGYAEQISVDQRNVFALPDGADERWAAVPVSYITAWNGLVAKCALGAGDVVVIWGAGGGLGNAALKIAVGLGAEVIAVVSTEAKREWLRTLGFEGVVLVRSEDIVKDVRAATGGRGADIVLDHVGASTWMTSIKMLATRGRLAFCGVTTGYEAPTDLRHIFGKQLSIHGSWIGDRQDLASVISLLSGNPALLPPIAQVFPLAEAQAAQDCLESGAQPGKILLAVQ